MAAGRYSKSHVWTFLIAAVMASGRAIAETPGEVELRERLRRLEDNQAKLYELLKAKDARLDAVEAELRRVRQAAKPGAAPGGAPSTAAKGKPIDSAPTTSKSTIVARQPSVATPGKPSPTVAAGDLGDAAPSTDAKSSPEKSIGETIMGRYEQGRGFTLAQTEWGGLNFGIYTYLRYLNQAGLDNTFINGLGEEQRIDKRNDIQLNKVKLEFRGWLLDPRFRFTLYTWTNNAAQGLGAQVVVGGNLNWRFGPWLNVGGGILSLPTTRSTAGNFPYWLTVDHRTIADEFFRGSYAQGIFGYGESNGFGYYAMLANNLSTLGVDAAQTDADLTTASGSVWWMPTTGEFGPRQGFGDYEDHQDLATRIGLHFTFSPEDRQSQPGTDDIDNTQIRLSNGTIIFTPGALAPGVAVESVKYYMADLDAGMKYRGFALEGEYYWRWLNDFRADGPVPENSLFDHGLQAMLSQMVWPKTMQLYTMGSYIFGDRNNAWEATAGLNYWMFHRRELRLNVEYIYDFKSPVGYTAIPQAVGGTGSIFTLNLELSF